MNILEQANQIVHTETERSKLYGSYHECNAKIAELMSVLCNKEITIEDVYKLQVAMKLAREIQHHKEENLLDAVAYIGALNDEYINK